MTTTAPRKVFINTYVADLKRSMEFFSKLGFEFNPRFTDEKAACMVLSEEGYVMLLTIPFFKTFTKRELCDTSTHTEVAIALSAQSRAECDDLLKRALAAGGKQPEPPQDHGFMYSTSFTDLDGHHWEAVWMDPKAITG